VILPLLLSLAQASPEMDGAEAIPPAPLSPIARALSLRPQVETLENGLTVVLHEDHRAPTVNLTTLVRVGSADDPEDASGLVHLIEHLMFKGSPNAPGAEWGRLLEQSGASSNAWTERDWTLYQSSGPASALERLLFLESDRLGWLSEAVTEDSILLEHRVIQNERASRAGGDELALFSTLHSLLWPEGHPYNRPVLGLEEHVKALDLGRIASFFASYYRPSNTVLVLSGDFERAEALALVQNAYGLIEHRGSRALRPYADRPRRGADTKRTWEVQGGRPLLAMGWNTPPWGHPDLPKLRLAAEVLRTRVAGLEDLAFNTKPQVALRARRAGGELVVRLVSSGAPLDDLLRAFDAELRDLALHGPTPKELDRARMRWQAKSIEDLEDLSAIGLALARCMAVHENPDCMGPEMQAIEAVSPQQVQAAIRTHLSRGRVLLGRLSSEQMDLALSDAEGLQ
jgi:predicted Zn-dependent peptidase